MPLTSTVSVAAYVKEATAAAHQRTEHLLLPHLTSMNSRTDYVRLLRMFYGFFHPMELRIRERIDASLLPDIDARRNSGFILLDLQALGDQGQPDLADRLPAIASAGEALGALYVLEGSTLGGKMIANMLRKNPALRLGEEHLHFFSGYREQTGSKWTQFLAVLNAQEEELNLIADTANASFDSLASWIHQTLNA
jgi:heme oxygenase (biliverdin-IX-beta and delta-forming)